MRFGCEADVAVCEELGLAYWSTSRAETELFLVGPWKCEWRCYNDVKIPHIFTEVPRFVEFRMLGMIPGRDEAGPGQP